MKKENRIHATTITLYYYLHVLWASVSVCAREWVYVLAGESAVFVVYIFQRQIAKYSTKSFFIKSRCLFLITILGAKSKSLQFWYFERANGKHNVVVCNQLTSAQLFWLWCKVGNNFSFICYFFFFGWMSTIILNYSISLSKWLIDRFLFMFFRFKYRIKKISETCCSNHNR